MPRISLKTLAAVVAIVAVAGGAVAFLRMRPLAVAVAAPQSDVVVQVFGLGTVEARVLTRIGFKVAGPLTELNADHGDTVAAGRVLARIDASEQAARLAKARAQLASAEATVQVAEAAAAKAAAVVAQRTQTNLRRKELLARQAVSVEAAEEAQLNEGVARADLAVANSEIEAAKARRDDARAQVRSDEVVLAQHELRAPFDGVVVLRAKELGSIAGAGEALFTVVDPKTVWALAYIDEGRAGDIQVGQPATLKLRSLPQQRFAAKVARIGIESDRVNEERRVYVACDDCPPAFFLGEQAEVFITTAVLARAVLVPEAAIGQFDGAHGIVWTVEDGRLARRRVDLGKRTLDGRVEITGGLPAGAQVATVADADFRDGRAARITAGTAP